MGTPAETVLDLIGNTPMVKLKRMSQGMPAEVWAKLEFFNPSGSVKDRIALRMIEDAEQRGLLAPGGIVVEPTSGNTGIGLALVCAIKGYRMIAVMPEAASEERRRIVEFLGGRVELTPCCDRGRGITKEDIELVLARAQELVAENENAYMPNQFSNPANPQMHAETTAEEILEATCGCFHAFVAACGTGGTFSGVARVLREKCPGAKTVLVEPSGSAVISGCEPGHHRIQGIGEGFIPETLDIKLADEVVQVGDEEAIATTRRLWREEGVMAGLSSGANVYAALQVAKKLNQGDIVVTIIADSGARYLSIKELQQL